MHAGRVWASDPNYSINSLRLILAFERSSYGFAALQEPQQSFRRDYIKVEFAEGPLYLYTHSTPGMHKVEQMKKLALAGKGLSSFISRKVRDQYASRLR